MNLSHLRPLAASLLLGGGIVAATASPALAATVTQSQTVGGATVATVGLSMSSATAALTNLSPGATATGSGTDSVVDTGSWTLSVADQAGGATSGHPIAASAGCTGSEPSLANPMSVTAAGVLGTVTPTGAVSLSSTPQPIASGTSSATLTNNYSDPVGIGEQLVTGCVYSLTAVYTLQG